MRIGNQPILAPKITHFVVPMGDGQQLVLKLAPVHDFTEFNKLCPEPTGTPRIYSGGRKEFVVSEEAQQAHLEQRLAYMVITSLKATEDLTWDTIALSDPATWTKWREEMKAAGLTDVYMNYLVKKIIDVSGMNPELIEKATEAFLAGQAADKVLANIPSSEPAST